MMLPFLIALIIILFVIVPLAILIDEEHNDKNSRGGMP